MIEITTAKPMKRQRSVHAYVGLLHNNGAGGVFEITRNKARIDGGAATYIRGE